MFNHLKDSAVKKCLELKSTLTPNRIDLLDLMIEIGKPLSAYEIKEVIKNKGNDLNISTIYRVMEFWCKNGTIHKITSLNKYTTCSNPEETHLHIVNVCTNCEELSETCNKRMGLDFKKGSKSLGLSISPNSHIEIPVICMECQ